MKLALVWQISAQSSKRRMAGGHVLPIPDNELPMIDNTQMLWHCWMHSASAEIDMAHSVHIISPVLLFFKNLSSISPAV
jgi:hypothetical protein